MRKIGPSSKNSISRKNRSRPSRRNATPAAKPLNRSWPGSAQSCALRSLRNYVMKTEDRLLTDVIRDAEYEEFQRELRERILREVRRKKAARAARVVLAMAAAVVLCASLWFREKPVANEEAVTPRHSAAPDRMIVRSSGVVEMVRSSGEIEVVR